MKPHGRFICSTYGNDHMREVSELVQKFDDRIVLAAENLYERFGKENGKEILRADFDKIEWRQYEDSLIVPEPEPLISYILSCHGNQGSIFWIITRSSSLMSGRRRRVDFILRKMQGFLLGIMVENNRNIVHNKRRYKYPKNNRCRKNMALIKKGDT